MRAAVFARHGGPDVIRIVDGWQEPELGCRRRGGGGRGLLAFAADGRLTPLIGRIVGLSGVAAAEQALEDHAVLGKIIVDPRLA